jgi:hypothetical protein
MDRKSALHLGARACRSLLKTMNREAFIPYIVDKPAPSAAHHRLVNINENTSAGRPHTRQRRREVFGLLELKAPRALVRRSTWVAEQAGTSDEVRRRGEHSETGRQMRYRDCCFLYFPVNFARRLLSPVPRVASAHRNCLQIVADSAARWDAGGRAPYLQ